jgi:hypothetical protein
MENMSAKINRFLSSRPVLSIAPFLLAGLIRVFIFLEHGLLRELQDRALIGWDIGRTSLTFDTIFAYVLVVAILIGIEELARRLPSWTTSLALVLFLLSSMIVPMQFLG